MNTHLARNYGLAALSAKVVLGASLALGFGSMPIGVAHAADADPGIVTDSTGQLRDCTVTDASGARADWDTSCDEYWS